MTQEPRKAKTNGPSDRGHFNGLDRLDSKNRVYSAETSAPQRGAQQGLVRTGGKCWLMVRDDFW